MKKGKYKHRITFLHNTPEGDRVTRELKAIAGDAQIFLPGANGELISTGIRLRDLPDGSIYPLRQDNGKKN